MKYYPSIPVLNQKNLPTSYCYLFEKPDGSNIRFEYQEKRGFFRFGSRNEVIDSSHPILGDADDIFRNNYQDSIIKTFEKNRIKQAIIYMEYVGDNSFAGTHIAEPHRLELFDINIHKKGFLEPKEFIRISYGIPDTVNLYYQGFITYDIIEEIKLSNLLNEGVVGKYISNNRIERFKIKTDIWIQKVKAKNIIADY